MRPAALLFCLALPLLAAKTLDIHFIDVEGGQATLIVTPKGESLLVDAGWPGFNGRDADRIVQTCKKAGVKKIDYLLMTHYHTDHVGGVTQLVERIDVATFISHGPNTETGKRAAEFQEAFDKAAARGKSLVVKPGDSLPLKGAELQILAARGNLISTPLQGAGQPNPLCASSIRKEDDPGENARSIGFLLTYGSFRFLNLADLTWNKEVDLMCPVNRIGKVDLYLVNHHGLALSNSPTLVHAVAPRVAIMNNGARKGGDADAITAIRQSPGLEDLWQLHYSVKAPKEVNTTDPFIANLQEPGGANLLVEAMADGSFRVVNQRNKFNKSYPVRAAR
jgi:beta-lactamase superfamily II metal-dependent hydrolase